MLTRLRVRNFKMLEELDIELGDRVVFIGPNNSGKTTAMQALTLWELGLRRWNGRRDEGDSMADERGVAINRRDATAIPGRKTDELWRNRIVAKPPGERHQHDDSNVPIEIIVNGRAMDEDWECGLKFEYANPESIYCRPLQSIEVPVAARSVRVALLPPMSGLIDEEVLVQPGAVNVRLGEGRTAEVLRNICLDLYQQYPERWMEVSERIQQLFGDSLHPPSYLPDRGSIAMTYDKNGINLDLTASGRGMLQTLLLLVHMHANLDYILLLDEPDAHLETLRQREIYDVLAESAAHNGNQIIIASHSEALLNYSAQTDTVIAFVGRPHRITGRQSQIAKALNQIGWEQYALAQEKGWVLYLEGATDLRVLQSLAQRLNHQRAVRALERPFVQYIGNVISRAQEHYYGLRIAVPNLKAYVLLDRPDEPVPAFPDAEVQTWHLREIENYLGGRAALEAYARAQQDEGAEVAVDPVVAMSEAIASVEAAARVLGQPPIWSADAKMSDDVLVPIFREFNQRRNQYNDMSKPNLHRLAAYIPDEALDPEITEKLDAIADVAESATPAGG